jgi:hypothetical protein
VHGESVRDKGTSQLRHSLGQTQGEEGQDQARARKPMREEGTCHSLVSRKRIAAERE